MSAGVIRRPFVGQLATFPSPDDPEVTFDFKRCGIRENVARQNLSATVRYVTEDGTGRFVTERDFPVGDLKFETVALSLAGWNLKDENEAPIPCTRTTMQDYLSPAEFEFCYQKALDVNPMWKNGGEEETKND